MPSPWPYRGPKTRSARGPARSMARGLAHQAIMRLAAKTLPCTARGTLACQMAWLDPLSTGIKKLPRKARTAQAEGSSTAPMRARARLERAMPRKTPWTRFLGPPHRERRSPPATPPSPAAERTKARAASDIPVLARTMAGRTVDPRVVRRLIPKNMSWRPRRGGLSRMKRNPKRASPIQEVFSRASSLGLGMGTRRRLRTAALAPRRSRAKIPPRPRGLRRAAARMGAPTPARDSARLIMPLARA